MFDESTTWKKFLERFRQRLDIGPAFFHELEDTGYQFVSLPAEAYQAAVCDMTDRTSTGLAPWTLVEANDTNFARVKVLQTVCQRLEAALKG